MKTSDSSIYYWGGHTSHTGQIFFDDNYTKSVQAVVPYSSNTVSRTLNSVDRVYTQQNGVNSLVTLSYVNQTQGINAGFVGTITVRVDSTVDTSSDTSASSTTTPTSKSSTLLSMTVLQNLILPHFFWLLSFERCHYLVL